MQYLIPSRLTEQRKKHKITKIAASNKMGITQSTYVRYENGDRNPTLATIKHMALILGTSADYLTGVTDDPSSDSLLIAKEDTPLLFEIVSNISEMPDKQLKRILTYCEKLQK